MGGVFMKSLSFVFNFIFADFLKFDPSTVYGLVLVFDFLLGYFVNRYYVFNQSRTKSGQRVLIQFILAGVAFRGLDWAIYVNLLSHFKVYILLAQLISTGVVLGSKFFIYRVIFR